MTTILLTLLLSTVAAQDNPQERPRVPDDSVEVLVIGCVTGRSFKPSDERNADVEKGPDIRGRSFRLAGKRDVMDEVKRLDKKLVEIVGVIKKSALDDRGVHVGRVGISGGAPVAGSSGKVPYADNVNVMDVSSIRQRASSCSQ
jgi:hypothetical protein